MIEIAQVVGTTRDTNDTSHVVDLPDSNEVDDILFAWFCNDGGGGGNQVFPASPAWNKFVDPDPATYGNEIRMIGFWRRIDGSEGWNDTGNSVTISLQGPEKISCLVSRITGVDPDEDPIFNHATGTTDNDPDPPNLSGGWGNGTLWIACEAHNDGSRFVTAYPSGFDLYQDSIGTAVGDCPRVSIAAKFDVASSVNPSAYAIQGAGNEVWGTVTIAFRPLPAPAKFSLDDMADPGVHTGHKIRIRARKVNAGDTGVLKVSLFQGPDT